MRFDTARAWWNGMNLRTRRDLIKQFRFKDRPEFKYEYLHVLERAIVDERFRNYKRVCERLDRERLA